MGTVTCDRCPVWKAYTSTAHGARRNAKVTLVELPDVGSFSLLAGRGLLRPQDFPLHFGRKVLGENWSNNGGG